MDEEMIGTPQCADVPFAVLSREALLEKANRLPLCPGESLLNGKNGKRSIIFTLRL